MNDSGVVDERITAGLDWVGLDWIESIGGFDKMEEDLLSSAPFVQFGGTVRIRGVSRTKKK